MLVHPAIPEGATVVGPQPGAQTAALRCPADILFFGGVAGASKTFSLLLEVARHINNPRFSAVIFRRETPQIENPGGLWDEACDLYLRMGGVSNQQRHEIRFPSGAKVRFSHMEREEDRKSWDGSQIAMIAFDQVEHFTRRQFFYMLSRNRSTCGVRPYMRATCNPINADDRVGGWVHRLIQWWIDEETGIAIESRSGVIRWFVLDQDEVIWGDSREEMVNRFPHIEPKSMTFIRGSLDENRALMDKDPGYKANLMALPFIDRQRLLHGNWNARESAGMFFKREWFSVHDAAPALESVVRYWDRAATANNPGGSWTAGCLMGRDASGLFWIVDVARFQETALGVERAIKNYASQDGDGVRVGIEQDPGQAGKAEAQLQVRNLAGYAASVNVVRESKGMRARPLSAQVEAGNVRLVKGPWNEAFIRECENFDGSDNCTSDQVDSASGAFHMLTAKREGGIY